MATSLVYEVNQYDVRNMVSGPVMTVLQASATVSTEVFTQTDLTNRTTAAALTANLTVGKGTSGDPLFGEVVWVSDEKLSAGTTSDSGARGATPKYVRVKVGGILTLAYNSNTDSAPALENAVVVDGAGKVIQAPAVASTGEFAAGYVANANQVIALNSVTVTTDDFAITVLVLKGGDQN